MCISFPTCEMQIVDCIIKILHFNTDFMYRILCNTNMVNGTFNSTFFFMDKWFENHDPSDIPIWKCRHFVKFCSLKTRDKDLGDIWDMNFWHVKHTIWHVWHFFLLLILWCLLCQLPVQDPRHCCKVGQQNKWDHFGSERIIYSGNWRPFCLVSVNP